MNEPGVMNDYSIVVNTDAMKTHFLQVLRHESYDKIRHLVNVVVDNTSPYSQKLISSKHPRKIIPYTTNRGMLIYTLNQIWNQHEDVRDYYPRPGHPVA